MKVDQFRIALAGCAVVLLAACNQVVIPALPNERLPPPAAAPTVVDTQTGPNPTPTTWEPKQNGAQMTQPAVSTPSSGLEFLIEKAQEDLAQRLSIALTQVSLVEAKEVVWPDSSLGCSQPGMAYLQVPEDGALIILLCVPIFPGGYCNRVMT